MDEKYIEEIRKEKRKNTIRKRIKWILQMVIGVSLSSSIPILTGMYVSELWAQILTIPCAISVFASIVIPGFKWVTHDDLNKNSFWY